MFAYRIVFFILLITNTLHSSTPHFDENTVTYIIETRQIIIPGHEHAFNPSIIRWQGKLLLCFREIMMPRSTGSSYGYDSRLGLVWLDEELNPVSQPTFLPLAQTPISSTEDARLVAVADELFLVYSDTCHQLFPGRGCRIFVANIRNNNEHFIVNHIDCLEYFDDAVYEKPEKNWMPFDYYGNLLLSYSLAPHRVLLPHLGSGYCELFSESPTPLNWPWGELRGGTPAILVDGQYLGFFHSSQEMSSLYSDEKPALHYFIGAYTFTSHYPFKITRVSPAPLFCEELYRSPDYVPYWKPVRVIFPCGILVEDDQIWVSLGKQDHEMWIVKFDKQLLLDSLIEIGHTGTD